MLLGIVLALIFASSTSTQSLTDAQKDQTLEFTYSDASKLINPALAKAMGGEVEESPGTAADRVRAGSLHAYFAFPANLMAEPVLVFGADQGIFKNGSYDAVAKQLVVLSAQKQLGSPELAAAVQGNFSTDLQTFKDGEPSGGLATVVPALLFLVLFYVVIILLANQMLASTLEKKESLGHLDDPDNPESDNAGGGKSHLPLLGGRRSIRGFCRPHGGGCAALHRWLYSVHRRSGGHRRGHADGKGRQCRVCAAHDHDVHTLLHRDHGGQ